MRLDSARELKVLLADTFTRADAPLRAAALGVAARTYDAAPSPPRSIALGITGRAQDDFMLAVRVQRRVLMRAPELELIRRKARGEVDVRYVGRIIKRSIPWHRRRRRPLIPGASIGHFKITAGTLGCFVRARTGEGILALSNNHVLANENDARKGDAVLQPGRSDGGSRPVDVVGHLVRFVRLKKRAGNQVDGAVARLDGDTVGDVGSLRGLGRLAGLGGEVAYRTGVAKVGRTTGVTHGRIRAFEMDNVVVDYDVGSLRFDGQIEIEATRDMPFSDGGDSGSLVVDAQYRAVALLFAGSDQGGAGDLGLTYANPIELVLAALRVQLLH